MQTPVRIPKSVSPQAVDDIEALVKSHKTLADVAAWLAKRGRKDGVSDVVTQDEYTHDVVVDLETHRYLVYDVT